MPRSRSIEQEQKLFDAAAAAYLHMLRTDCPEHFMEATPQGKQREITLASLALVHERRPEVQVFNELLVQYRRDGETKIRQVVPDNMVVVHPEPIVAGTSFAISLQPVKPFWTLEYVSKGSLRKDYEDSFQKYERDLQVPYYLAFYPDNQELNLWRLNTRKRYSSVKPNGGGRYSLPDLEMEVAIHDGWVRYWFRGDLLQLPGALLRQLDAADKRITELGKQMNVLGQRAERESRRAELAEQELAQMRAELDKLRAERKSG